MRDKIGKLLVMATLAATVACNGIGNADGSVAKPADTTADSVANEARIDSMRQAAERDSAIVKHVRDSLAADPNYQELKKLIADEAKDFPKELMPGLLLANNYIEGREFYYLYGVDERQMDFKNIVTQRDEMRRSMAESIKKSVAEKGNPMGRFVELCIKCGVNVNYMFEGAQSRRTMVISYTPAELRTIVAK